MPRPPEESRAFAAAQILVCGQLAATVGLLIHTISGFSHAHDRTDRPGSGFGSGFAAFWWGLALFSVLAALCLLAFGLLRLDRDNVTFFFAEFLVGLAGALVGIASGAHPGTVLIALLALSGYAGMYLSFALHKAIEQGGRRPESRAERRARTADDPQDRRPLLRPARRPGRR